MAIAVGNLFEFIPECVEGEVFSELARGKNIRIERIVSTGQSSPETGWYDQDDNEWIAVLQGKATITFEESADVHLYAGSYLNIPAHTRHKVAFTTPDSETIWLAVHYR